LTVSPVILYWRNFQTTLGITISSLGGSRATGTVGVVEVGAIRDSGDQLMQRLLA
jgi:hypothetical protein